MRSKRPPPTRGESKSRPCWRFLAKGFVLDGAAKRIVTSPKTVRSVISFARLTRSPHTTSAHPQATFYAVGNKPRNGGFVAVFCRASAVKTFGSQQDRRPALPCRHNILRLEQIEQWPSAARMSPYRDRHRVVTSDGSAHPPPSLCDGFGQPIVMRARGNRRSNPASPRLRGHIANVVTLTERHAVMSEDVVGGRDVEIEVRECKAG